MGGGGGVWGGGGGGAERSLAEIESPQRKIMFYSTTLSTHFVLSRLPAGIIIIIIII